MAIPEHSRLRLRIAAVLLVGAFSAAALFTYLSYTAAFTPTTRVTVTAPRAGLVMDVDAKVKFRGMQIGKVKSIEYNGNEAELTLAIISAQLRYLPSDAKVRIAGTTVFGGKSVEFLAPTDWSGASLKPDSHIAASDVQLEVNTLFQTLTDVLDKVDPVELNATMTALADGLRGQGDDLGASLSGTNELLTRLNPYLPTLQSDVRKGAEVANVYADAGPDLVTVVDNAPTIAGTIVDQQTNLNAVLLGTTALADNGYAALQPASQDFIAAIQRFRAPLKVLAEYSPQFGCLFEGSALTVDVFGQVVGGGGAGVLASSSFIPGVPAYTYPESLPIVNAGGGPNCRGIPDLPGKNRNGSWYKAPYLVTDSAYVPFQPNTELQFDPPSTLQFLFNGAYAERDDF